MIGLRALAAFRLMLTAMGAACAQPQEAAADPVLSGTLIVGNKGEGTVSFIDLATGKEFQRSDTGPMPHEVAISPDGGSAAVVAYGGTSIQLFDVATGLDFNTIDLSPNARPHGIVWLDDWTIVATTEGSDTLTLLLPDDNSGNGFRVEGIPTGNKGSHMVAVTADGSRAFVSNLQSRNVSVIDIGARLKLLDLSAGTEPEGIALTPDDTQLWVAARGSNEVFVFDAGTLEQVDRIDVGNFPIRIAISPDGRHAVTSNLADGTVSVIDVASREVVRTIEVSGEAEAMQVTIVFSPDGKRLYLAETGRDTVAEIDFASGRVLRRFAVGTDGDGLGISDVAPQAR